MDSQLLPLEMSPQKVMLSLSELGRQKGVSKQAISKRVASLVERGLLRVYEGRHGTKMVSLAEYDRVLGDTADLGREQAAATRKQQKPNQILRPSAPEAGDTTQDNFVYTYEQARNMAFRADMAQLELNARLGKMLPIDQVEAAMTQAAEIMVRKIDLLPSEAEALASAIAKSGTVGARDMLKEIARQLRERLADALIVHTQPVKPINDDNDTDSADTGE